MTHSFRLALCVALSASTASAQLSVVSIEPARHTLAGVDASVTIDFDRALDTATVPGAFSVFGRMSGTKTGTTIFANADTRLVFTPSVPFLPGEEVVVSFSNTLEADDGTALRSAGWVSAFSTRVARAGMDFVQIDSKSSRTTPGVSSRIYGGAPGDWNEDGWGDIALVNEDTSDVRMMLNGADGTGLHDDFLNPPMGTGDVPSPSQTADFDGDGHMDLCTANTFGDSISVLLGNGDGTYASTAEYPAGNNPRGIAALDMDGDGDWDIAAANNQSGFLTLHLNNGDGTFAPATTMEGGGSGEWGLAPGDMNEDGIMDLVVGARNSGRIIIQLGNGDGTFTQGGVRNGVGSIWMIVLGDVNGDGHMDVSTGNSGSASGSILLGDGAGNVGVPQIRPAAAFVTATDLGDLDGDGDLDWVLSDFSGGIWRVYTNDGAGNFAFSRDFNATSNPGCAVLMDFDHDHDLDICLLDEIADLAIFMENRTPGADFCYGDGTTTACPCGNGSLAGADTGCEHSGGHGAKLAAFGTTSVASDDLELLATGVPANRPGLIFGGTSSPAFAFGDGVRCVGGAVQRFPVRFSDSAGTLAQDRIASIAGASSGDTRYFQCWFRDPMGPCGQGFALSAAYELTFQP